jgi:transposase
MKITTVGIDLAKHVFQVHGVDERGKVVPKKQLKRHQVLPFFANLPACLIGMEACGGPTTGRADSRLKAIPCG